MSLSEVNVIVERGNLLNLKLDVVSFDCSPTDVVPSHPYPYQGELYK